VSGLDIPANASHRRPDHCRHRDGRVRSARQRRSGDHSRSEVAAALSAGVAVGAIGAALPVKELGRKDAERLGAEERARFGSVAAMHAAGIELSPFQDQAFLNSLPTEAQLQSRVPNPSAMTAPSFTYEPTAPGENLTSYPQYVAPLDALTLPDPGAPGAAPPNGTPLSMPEIGDTSVEAYAYVSSAGSKEGAAALAAVNKCMPGEEAFRSFGALKNGMHYPTDWEVHHLVEQNQTSRFGSELIQSTANAVALPDDVHRWISSVNSSKPPLDSGVDRTQFSRMRDYVRSLPFDEQRELGIQQVRDAMDALRTPQNVRDQIEKQLDRLDVPDLCAPPVPPLPQLPDANDIQNAVDAHNKTSSRPLPDVRSVAAYDGTTRSGTFLDLGSSMVAQHQGRGAYVIADISRDLNGQQPPLGQYVTLTQAGQIQVPQQSQNLGLGMG